MSFKRALKISNSKKADISKLSEYFKSIDINKLFDNEFENKIDILIESETQNNDIKNLLSSMKDINELNNEKFLILMMLVEKTNKNQEKIIKNIINLKKMVEKLSKNSK